MALVTAPNAPWNGTFRWNELACCQLTCPVMTGISPDANASTAEPVAMTIANRVTHRTPTRFNAVKASTIRLASSLIGTPGRYHWWIADADRIAVSPQVGTQPHQ